MDLSSYKPPIKEGTKDKRLGINNEFKFYIHELLVPLNHSRKAAGLELFSTKTFLKIVSRRYGKADEKTLKYIYETAKRFNSFTHGITYLTKKQ